MTEHLHRIDLPTASVRWEPCEGFRADAPDDHECHACGWPVDEHRLALAS
jgi:hypothetical protein